jgi:DNA-binding CsgD family transcriptional regulator
MAEDVLIRDSSQGIRRRGGESLPMRNPGVELHGEELLGESRRSLQSRATIPLDARDAPVGLARNEAAVGKILDALSREGARFAPHVLGDVSPFMGVASGYEIVIDMKLEELRVVVLQPVSHPVEQAVRLTAREHEIARLVAAGYPNKTIASVLGISVWTVSTYLRRMFAKLGVTSRAAMVSAIAFTGSGTDDAHARTRAGPRPRRATPEPGSGRPR